MKIPESAIDLIIKQRSGYTNIKKDYITDMEKEFSEMLPLIPKTAKNIMDIGCGLCGIDVLLYNHYGKKPVMCLVDKDIVEEKLYYGYKSRTPFYNSFDIAREILETNGVERDQIKFISAANGEDISPTIPKQELIISLLSCGYHYPVEMYLSKIKDLLSADGVLIIDIRQGTPGISAIKTYFPNIKIMSTYNKSFRICARRF